MVWKGLHHPNVLPLLGVTINTNRFAIVSEWMRNGNINEFVKEHSKVNRLELVCFCPRSLSSLVTDNRAINAASRRH